MTRRRTPKRPTAKPAKVTPTPGEIHSPGARTWRERLQRVFPAGRATGLLALVLTVVALVFHAIFLTHAGGLWRDESNTVVMATLPSLSEMWAVLSRDNTAMLPLLLLRSWCGLGIGATDLGLRVFGLVVGVALLAAFWLGSWTMRRQAPILALALVGVNAAMIRSIDTLRSYGVGSVLAVLAFAAIWHLVARPGLRRGAVAALAAIASVQALYGNAFLLLAAGTAGMLVCARRRDWRGVGWIALAGGLAAASLLPYVPGVLEAQSWYELEQGGFSLAVAWDRLRVAAGSPHPAMHWVWTGLVIAAAGAGVTALWVRRAWAAGFASIDPADDVRLIVYGGVAAGLGVASYAVFLTLANLPTQYWYYAPLLAFLAACVDTALGTSHRAARGAAVVVAVAVLIAASITGTDALRVRQTNVDDIAARLSSEASPEDFIIVHPWYCGVSFTRYFRGQTPWETLPPLEEHRIHRYDQFKVQMQMPAPIDPVLARVVNTLQRGRRVWVVGWIPFPERPLGRLPPAPRSPFGWSDEPYSQAWGAELGYLLRARALDGKVVMNAPAPGVSPFENLPLAAFEGWRW